MTKIIVHIVQDVVNIGGDIIIIGQNIVHIDQEKDFMSGYICENNGNQKISF